MVRLSHLLLAFVAVILLACQQQTLSADEIRKIVNERNDKLGHFFTSGNADSLSLMYAPDARLCLNGVDFISGRADIRNFWKDDMKSTKTLEMRTETLTVGGVREVIYETGRTHLKMTYLDSTFNLTVKYCNVWRRQTNGTYLLDVDIANRDKPAE